MKRLENQEIDKSGAARPLTIVDVARAAGVAQSTVSLFFRDPSRVAPKSAEKIRRVVSETGYRPNLAASGLRSLRSQIVGVMVPSLTEFTGAAAVETLQAELRAANLQTQINLTNYDKQSEADSLEALLAWSPAGIVLTGTDHSQGVRIRLLEAGIPVVELWDVSGRAVDLTVGFSHEACGAAMFDHLYEVGARRFAFLGTRLDLNVRAAKRAKGFMAAANARNCHVELFQSSVGTSMPYLGGVLAGMAFDVVDGYDAFACSHDLIALGALFEAQRRSIRVPEKTKIIGFGDASFCTSTVPSLSTIAPPSKEIGIVAVRELTARIRGERSQRRVFDLGFDLIRRGTT
ncbi:MAG: LacI family DNA-binding transcriptional regulator [Magnetospirillum sp.]|nr:LacI family DNA-binding transcriptional regulator [Magnetospirillum sp.]